MGLGPRRPSRVESQRTHELGPAALVARIETTLPGLVCTEREGRARQGEGAGRFSVMVAGGSGRRELRWPDLVVETGRRRAATRAGAAAKTTERLTRIVVGYMYGGIFNEVRFGRPASTGPTACPGLRRRRPDDAGLGRHPGANDVARRGLARRARRAARAGRRRAGLPACGSWRCGSEATTSESGTGAASDKASVQRQSPRWLRVRGP